MNPALPAIPASLQTALLACRTQLLARVQHLPPVGARPLVIAGRVAGWASAAARQALADLPTVRVLPQALVLWPDVSSYVSSHASSPIPSHVLAEAADALRTASCLRGWRGELLDVMGEGRVLGQMERSAFRPLGLLTQAVRLNAWTEQGELWIARRAAHKTTDPGKWDTLAGGLVATGEAPQQALLREAHEEAGLIAQNLVPRRPLRLAARLHKRLPQGEGYLVENTWVSDCLLADGVQPHNLDGEADAFCKVQPDALWELLKTDAFTAEAAWTIVDSLLGA